MAAGSLKNTSFGVLPMLVFFVLLLVSLSYLSDATHNSERFGQMYSGLLIINAVGLVFLGALVIINIITLIRQRRMKAAGRSVRYIADVLEISRGTVHRAVKGAA